MIKPLPFTAAVAIGIAMWSLPAPEGLEGSPWQLFAIFTATVIAIITQAMPMGVAALFALTLLSVTGTLTLQEALGGFSNPVVWLIVFAFLVAKSFIKTGLGFRIAYHLVALFGKKSLGLAYSMALTDLMLAPAIPSNSARGGGIIYPIIKSLALTFESSPENKTERRIGSYLFKNAYQINVVTSAMFLTAMAANPMMAEMAEELNIPITWGTWALAAAVPGGLAILIIPWLLFKLYPPEVKETPQARGMAKQHLAEMGSMRAKEWITLAVFVLMLFLWIFGGIYLIHFDDNFVITDVQHLKSESTITAMIGISLLLFTGVLNWNDVVEEKDAWNTLFWFSTLITMASYLTKMGVIGWMSESLQEMVVKLPQTSAWVLLLLGYFYSHYFFASATAHASSMYAAFLVVGITLGAPPLPWALSLAFISSISACLTHYGMAPGPIFFGSGYVDLASWWKLGAIIGVVHLILWMGVGPLWWKLAGIW